MKRVRTAVLISGRGSNMKALLDAAKDPAYPAEIVLVAANVPGAGGLDIARAAGIDTATIDHRGKGGREAFERELHARLLEAGTELVCLAGFMRLLSPGFVATWRNRMINIHPSLLPAFPGLDTHARALAAGVRFAGCTVHFVRDETDTGPIIVQAAVPVLPDDTEASLAARVLEAEHRAYPLALRLVAEGRVRVDGERAIVDAPAAAAESHLNPARA